MEMQIGNMYDGRAHLYFGIHSADSVIFSIDTLYEIYVTVLLIIRERLLVQSRMPIF